MRAQCAPVIDDNEGGRCPVRPVTLVVALLFVCTCPLAAQQATWIAPLLDSPDWTIRSGALSGLDALPTDSVPDAVRVKLFSLLEREGLRPDEGESGEGYGEYVIHLVETVLRYKDARSLRGMALLGSQTSREAEEFVASYGSAALPALDEAWRVGGEARQTAVETYGYMLAAPRSGARRTVLRLLIPAADSLPVELGDVALAAGLVASLPLLERALEAAPPGLERSELERATDVLRFRRDTTSAAAIAAELLDWIQGFCYGSAGPRRSTCLETVAPLVEIRGRADRRLDRSGKALLAALASRVEEVGRRGVWEPREALLVAGTARYLSQHR